MTKNKTVDKVVEFSQSVTKTKRFRNDHPISDELREEMIDKVFIGFMKYAMELNYLEYLPLLKEYVDEFNLTEEKEHSLEGNIFWWRILYDSSMGYRESCLEDYIGDHFRWQEKKPLIVSWLRECGKSVPRVYYLCYKHNDRSIVVIDVLEEKLLDVIVLDPQAIQPKVGEFMMGTLIPIGDGIYFPIVDFYHFDYEAREEIAQHIHYYYEKYLKTFPVQEAFIHVCSAMLQIEKFVLLKKENASK